MGLPETCDICAKGKINAGLFQGSIEMGSRPFKGPNPSVMLVGQDPTIAKGQVDSVLDLENPSGQLYRFLVTEILEQVGLKVENVYATDLVKCRFPNNQTPRAISQNHRIGIKDFLCPFFRNCRQWFFQEAREIRPMLVLSLGQPVHQMLIEEFGWDIPSGMKDAFSKFCKVQLLGENTFYVPCIHINSRAHSHYKDRWKKFTENLEEALDSAGIV